MSSDFNSIFFDNYVHQIINTGSFGEVSFTRDASGRIIANKRLKPGEESFRFLAKSVYLNKEYIITKYLSGTGVVPEVYGRKMIARMIDGVHVPMVSNIEMEFVGPTIKLCDNMGFLIEPKTMLKQLLQACAHLHHLQVLHLDLKPDNVTFDLTRRKIMLIDFGLSEMTSFLDIETECGIKKWEKSPRCLSRLPFGQVTSEGMLHSVAKANLPYVQSQFHRPIRGQTRLYNAVNIPGFGEPLSLMSEVMGVSSGCVLDEKSDVYSAGMILLNHVGVCDVRSLWKTDCPPEEVLLNWLDLLVHTRGSSTNAEMLEIEKELLEMAMICEADGSVFDRNTALRRAVRKTLTDSGKSVGLYNEMCSVLGGGVSNILLDMINPLPKNRPKAYQALTRLSADIPEHTRRRSADVPNHAQDNRCRTSFYVDILNEHILVGRIFENGVWSASLSVDLRNCSLLWSKGTAHFRNRQDADRDEALNVLIHIMRQKAGSPINRDARTWFRSLTSSHLLFDDLNILNKL